MTDPTPNATDEELAEHEARVERTVRGIVELIGDEALLCISDAIRETTRPEWHDHDDPDCICPAMMAFGELYSHGFGILPLPMIHEATPYLERKMQGRAGKN